MKSNVLAENERRTYHLPVGGFDFEILGDEDLAAEALIQGFIVAGEGFGFVIPGFAGRSYLDGAFRAYAFT